MMFEKNMKIAYLLDFYIDALDEHSATIMKAYYEDDLSLAEIARGEGISRQGIRHIIKKGEEQLEFLESRLGLARRYTELEDAVKVLWEIKEHLSASSDERFLKDAERIDETVAVILNKGV